MPGFSMLSTRTSMLALVALAACLLPAPARADNLLSTTVSSASSAYRECAASAAPGSAGVVTRQIAAPMSGIVSAKLNAGGGDWDLAVFETATGRTVGGSAGFNGVEVASGFIGRAASLTVQACRLSGSTGSANLDVAFAAIPTGRFGQRAQLVSVKTPTPLHKQLLNLLDLDLTEHGRSGFVDVVLYGNQDAEILRQAGLEYEVEIPDLAARDRQNARQDIAFAAATTQSRLPSGIDAYRHLWEYEYALKELARHYPNLAIPITLPFTTNEGRQVHGVEITQNAHKVRDGKPVYVQLGVHHAREWPSGEHAMEFGFDLAMNYGKDARDHLAGRQGADGRRAGRERRRLQPVAGGSRRPTRRDRRRHRQRRIRGDVAERAFLRLQAAQLPPCRRRAVAGSDCGTPGPPLHRRRPEPQLRRTVGRPGRQLPARDDTYRGAGPFSEPETHNIRDLVSNRQVTTLITNHTFSNLVLRPPGVQAQGPPGTSRSTTTSAGAWPPRTGT